MIEVENLHKSFGQNRAVNDVSFRIEAGEVVGFLGPNGAGKTTTMRMITTYLVPDRGRVTIGGIDVLKDPFKVRQQIGYLPESAPLYVDMEVLEYLRYVASIRGVPKERKKRRIRELVEACGLRDVLRRQIGFLSKGYRQRVGLAQSMIHDPKILIMDEPTSGLDPNQIVEVRDLIRDIGKEKTVILSTHILPEVQTTCNRVIIINKGRMVGDGSLDELSKQVKREKAYRVAVDGDEKAAESVFLEAAFVTDCQMIADTEGKSGFILKCVAEGNEMGNMGGEIFRLAVAKGLVLTEIKQETASLENVFASLTLGDGEQ